MNASQPILIIINGMPGVGKTTLAHRLAKDTGLLQVSKDDLKEYLFDKLGVGDREWSRTLGRAVSIMLYPLAESLLAQSYNLILESAFHSEFARGPLKEVIEQHNVRCLEIYCQLEPSERHRRFVTRNESGQRHKGHADAYSYDDLARKDAMALYAPLEIGLLWEIDTLHFGDKEYNKLLQKLNLFLKEATDHESTN